MQKVVLLALLGCVMTTNAVNKHRDARSSKISTTHGSFNPFLLGLQAKIAVQTNLSKRSPFDDAIFY